MKGLLLFLSILTVTRVVAQDEAVRIESDAHVVFSGDVNLVLDAISLQNEGIIDGASGHIMATPRANTLTLETNSTITLSSLGIGSFGGFATVYGALALTDLSIASNDNLSVADTSSLTVSGTLQNMGNLSIESGGALWIKGSVTSIANGVTVNRITTFDSNTGKYSVVGSPVNSSDFSALGTKAQNWIFEYDETELYGSDGAARFQSPTESSMIVGKGYFSAFTGDEDGEVSFYGIPEYKNLNYGVTYTDNDEGVSVMGYNLLSNPYTCPIDAASFLNDNTSMLSEETIWIWDDYGSDTDDSNNSDYLTINDLGLTGDSRNARGTDWDGTINVAQGFFIKASSTGDVSFKQTMKTLEGNDDASFYRTTITEVEKYWFNLAKADGTVGTNTLIGFHPDATEGIDKRFDASKFGGSFSVYSLVNDQKLAIQGLPDDWTDEPFSNEVIPLGYQIAEKGTYTLHLEKQEHASGQALYLNDLLTGTATDLTNETYSFQSEAGSFNERFTLSLAPVDVKNILNAHLLLDVQVYGADGFVGVQVDQRSHAHIWSLDGRMLADQPVTEGTNQIAMPKPGVYVVSIELSGERMTFKVAVK